MDDKNKQQEDYLSKFVNNTESIGKEVSEIKSSIQKDMKPSLDFLSVDLDMLPCGMFYNPETQIKIRAAKVTDIQYYSVVDDKNILDVTEKMNQMLSSCVKVILPNGMQGSYKNLRDGDRLFIIFMIRELTFQKGNSLAKEVICNKCQTEFKIPFRATSNAEAEKSFVKYDIPEELENFFNRELRCFEFNINGASYKLAPPTIGIQEIFYDDIKNKVNSKKSPNVSFLKIIPYLLWDRDTITEDGIKAKEDEFKKMDMYTFQMLNQIVNKMIFGLKGLKKLCPECNQEVCTDMSFPEGASSLFVIPSVFEDFIRK